MSPINAVSSGSPFSVLVVDDEPLIRIYVSDVLRQSGFRVIVANNGEDVLERAKHENVSAVVSDVAMPGAIDLVELACRLKGDSPSTGVILLSGVANPADHQLPPGVRFLPKPVKATTLLRLLREVAGLRTTPPA